MGSLNTISRKRGDQRFWLFIAPSRFYWQSTNGIWVNEAADIRALTIVINQLPLRDEIADIAKMSPLRCKASQSDTQYESWRQFQPSPQELRGR